MDDLPEPEPSEPVDHKAELARDVLIDIAACGAVEVRDRGSKITRGLLPFFSVHTRAHADAMITRHCRREREGTPRIHRVNDPPSDVEGIWNLREVWAESYRNGAGVEDT